jgi:hypothetical protein
MSRVLVCREERPGGLGGRPRFSSERYNSVVGTGIGSWIPITDVFRTGADWDGEVEIYALTGQSKARRCHALVGGTAPGAR